MTVRRILPFAAILALGFVACSDDDDSEPAGAATADIYTYGEPFIEEGIPAEEMTDGWAVTFDNFVITMTDASIDGADTWSEAVNNAVYVDVAKSGADASNPGHEIGTIGLVAARSYDSAAYTIAPSDMGTNVNVDADVLEDLQAAGASILVRGSATDGTDTVTFDWNLDSSTTYSPCELEGFSVAEDQSGRVELTIHGDHLFYDSVSSDEPELIFQPYADADADEDGAISMAELEAVDIAETSFNAAGASDIENLLDYLAFQTRTLGHINGEGHCGE